MEPSRQKTAALLAASLHESCGCRVRVLNSQTFLKLAPIWES